MDSRTDAKLTVAPLGLRLRAGLERLATEGVLDLSIPAALLWIGRRIHGSSEWPARRYIHSWSWMSWWRISLVERGSGPPSWRRAHIRAVDSRTGAPASLRAICTAAVCGRCIASLVWWPFAGARDRNVKRLGGLQPQIEQLKQKYAGDKHAEQEALMSLYKQHDVNPLKACVPMLAPAAIQLAVFFLSPNHQTPGQRLASIVIVVESE